MAIQNALIVGKEIEWRKIEVQSNYKGLVEKINSRNNRNSSIETILEDIQDLSDLFDQCTIFCAQIRK